MALDRKALNDIVIKQLNEIDIEAIMLSDKVLYAKEFVVQNYDHLKKDVYNNEELNNSDAMIYLRVKADLQKLISLSESQHPEFHEIHVQNSPDRKNFGILYEWVDWTTSDKFENGYKAVINENGRKIIDGWKDYRKNRKQ